MTFRLKFTWWGRFMAALALFHLGLGLALAWGASDASPAERAVILLVLTGVAAMFLALRRALASASVDVDGPEIRVRAGFLLQGAIPLAMVENMRIERWKWWKGMGIHADFRGGVSAVSSPGQVVAFALKEPQPIRFFPWPGKLKVRRLWLTPERREEFMALIAARIG